MTLPSEMLALLQTQDGYSGTSEGPHIDKTRRLRGSQQHPRAFPE